MTERVRLVLVSHGSSDPRHARAVGRLGADLAERLGATVVAGFLEHDRPSVSEILVPPPGVRRTVVLPLLLTAGYHWHHDLPPVVAHDGATAVLVAPPTMSTVARAVAPLVEGSRHVVLAGSGSTRASAVARFAELADRLHTANRAVAVALGPDDVPPAVRSDSVVVPVLVADGGFADRIRAAGARTTAVLGETPGFAEALAADLRDVVADQVDSSEVAVSRVSRHSATASDRWCPEPPTSSQDRSRPMANHTSIRTAMAVTADVSRG
ncbi:MAG: CbiX/SirB N-terminal domain-containing protein [Candidatus Nanopelagicales bacterium]